MSTSSHLYYNMVLIANLIYSIFIRIKFHLKAYLKSKFVYNHWYCSSTIFFIKQCMVRFSILFVTAYVNTNEMIYVVY